MRILILALLLTLGCSLKRPSRQSFVPIYVCPDCVDIDFSYGQPHGEPRYIRIATLSFPRGKMQPNGNGLAFETDGMDLDISNDGQKWQHLLGDKRCEP